MAQSPINRPIWSHWLRSKIAPIKVDNQFVFPLLSSQVRRHTCRVRLLGLKQRRRVVTSEFVSIWLMKRGSKVVQNTFFHSLLDCYLNDIFGLFFSSCSKPNLPNAGFQTLLSAATTISNNIKPSLNWQTTNWVHWYGVSWAIWRLAIKQHKNIITKVSGVREDPSDQTYKLLMITIYDCTAERVIFRTLGNFSKP